MRRASKVVQLSFQIGIYVALTNSYAVAAEANAAANVSYGHVNATLPTFDLGHLVCKETYTE